MDKRAKAALLSGRERECRFSPGPRVEIRADGDTLTMSGYASVFDVWYEMGWYREIVRRGAFAKTLAEGADVQLLVNHAGLPLARTASKTMTLAEDQIGLRVEAELDAGDPDVSRLKGKMDRGDLNEMSFGFWTVRQAWTEDYDERELLEIRLDRGDVSVVNFGANPSTSVSLRSLEALQSLAGLDAEAVLAEIRSANVDPATLLGDARTEIDRILATLTPASEPAGDLDLYRAQLEALSLRRTA